MRNLVSSLFVIAALAGCAAHSADEDSTKTAEAALPPPAQVPPPAPVPASPSAGTTLLSVVGTPFLVIFKIPVCILTVVVAGPVAGVSELSNPSDPAGADLRRQLGQGIEQNCGPPYVISP